MTSSNQIINEIFERLFSPSEWIQFSMRFLKYLSIEEAVVFSYLIGQSRRLKAWKLRRGWFYTSVKKIVREFKISDYTQARIIKGLQKKGFLRIERRGVPCRRWMQINLLVLGEIALNRYSPVPKVSQELVHQPSKQHKVKVISFGYKVEGNSPRSFNDHCAQYMKESVLKHTRRIPKWKFSKQAIHIGTLCNRFKTKEDFLDVFEWYCDHLGEVKELGLPVCYSPDELLPKKVWNWIEDKFNKVGHREKETVISAEAETIFNSVKGLGWPKGSKEQLPKLIQLSLNEYNDFKKRMLRYLKKQQKHFKFADKKRNWINYVEHLTLKFPGAYTMVSNWFRALRTQIEGWKNWQGDLYEHRLHVQHKRFLAEGRSITTTYGCKAEDFNHLLETVYAK